MTGFLRALADPAKPTLDAERVCLVVAHPDDETAGLGGQLHRLRGLRVIHSTDGAPRRGPDLADRGFTRAEDYAQARRRELEAAMALAGIKPERLECLWIPDQEAAHQMGRLTDELVRRLQDWRIQQVITLAYEGGHPDHDATAFCVHRACRRLPEAPEIYEFPLYHQGPEGEALQVFVPMAATEEVELPLDDDQRARKREMLAAHQTQARALSVMKRMDRELIRRAPDYDFLQLPNAGRLFYLNYDWGLDGPLWLQRVRALQ
jgi:N-acetylglucosamine malate deacetylase 2